MPGVGVVIGSQIPWKSPIYNRCLSADNGRPSPHSRRWPRDSRESQRSRSGVQSQSGGVRRARRRLRPARHRMSCCIYRLSSLHRAVVGSQAAMVRRYFVALPRVFLACRPYLVVLWARARVGAFPMARCGLQSMLVHPFTTLTRRYSCHAFPEPSPRSLR
jgi:hypothetical protein